jgi:pectin methylesterase-like acyl-CoA thioesterase
MSQPCRETHFARGGQIAIIKVNMDENIVKIHPWHEQKAVIIRGYAKDPVPPLLEKVGLRPTNYNKFDLRPHIYQY